MSSRAERALAYVRLLHPAPGPPGLFDRAPIAVAFRGTPFEPLLRRLGPALRWSPGFRLGPGEFPADLRGPSVPPFAVAVARRYGSPLLDAELIGRAARAPGGAVLPGLYAAGRNAVGICSNSYVSGLSLADCVFSGRRAGRHAATRTGARRA